MLKALLDHLLEPRQPVGPPLRHVRQSNSKVRANLGAAERGGCYSEWVLITKLNKGEQDDEISKWRRNDI